jgi:hypothetical protein
MHIGKGIIMKERRWDCGRPWPLTLKILVYGANAY